MFKSKNGKTYKRNAIHYLFKLEGYSSNKQQQFDNESSANLILDLLKTIKPISKDSFIPSYIENIIKKYTPNQLNYIKNQRYQQLKLYPIGLINNLTSVINETTEDDIIDAIGKLDNQLVADNITIFKSILLPLHQSNSNKVTSKVLELYIQKTIENKLLPNKYYSRLISQKPDKMNLTEFMNEDDLKNDKNSQIVKKVKTENGSIVSKTIKKPKVSNLEFNIHLEHWSELNKYSTTFSKSLINNLIECFKDSLIYNNNNQINTNVYNHILSIYQSILNLTNVNQYDIDQFLKYQNEYYELIIENSFTTKKNINLKILENWLSLFDLPDSTSSNKQLEYSNFINNGIINLFKTILNPLNLNYFNDKFNNNKKFNIEAFIKLWKKGIEFEYLEINKIEYLYSYRISNRSVKVCNNKDGCNCNEFNEFLKSTNQDIVTLRTLIREREYLLNILDNEMNDIIQYSIKTIKGCKSIEAKKIKKYLNNNNTTYIYYLDFKNKFLENLNLFLNITKSFIPSLESNFKSYDQQFYNTFIAKINNYNEIIKKLISNDYKIDTIKIN